MKRSVVALILLSSLFLLLSSCRTKPTDAVQQTKEEEAPFPDREVLKGYIAKRVENRGTLSENSYYVLSKEPRSRQGGLILYMAETGKSRGFDAYEGMYVTIMGEYGSGAADWKGTARPGFLVETITTGN